MWDARPADQNAGRNAYQDAGGPATRAADQNVRPGRARVRRHLPPAPERAPRPAAAGGAGGRGGRRRGGPAGPVAVLHRGAAGAGGGGGRVCGRAGRPRPRVGGQRRGPALRAHAGAAAGPHQRAECGAGLHVPRPAGGDRSPARRHVRPGPGDDGRGAPAGGAVLRAPHAAGLRGVPGQLQQPHGAHVVGAARGGVAAGLPPLDLPRRRGVHRVRAV